MCEWLSVRAVFSLLPVNGQANFTNSLGAINDIANGLVFCHNQCSGGSFSYCNSHFSSLYTDAQSANTTWTHQGAISGAGLCNSTSDLQARYLRAPSSSVNSLFWLQSGILAQVRGACRLLATWRCPR